MDGKKLPTCNVCRPDNGYHSAVYHGGKWAAEHDENGKLRREAEALGGVYLATWPDNGNISAVAVDVDKNFCTTEPDKVGTAAREPLNRDSKGSLPKPSSGT